MVVLSAAAEPERPQSEGLTLVSTLEPCVMCWGACLELKVQRIVYGLEAPPNGGSTRVYDPNRPCTVVGPVLRRACRELLVQWLIAHRQDAGASLVRSLIDTTAANGPSEKQTQ